MPSPWISFSILVGTLAIGAACGDDGGGADDGAADDSTGPASSSSADDSGSSSGGSVDDDSGSSSGGTVDDDSGSSGSDGPGSSESSGADSSGGSESGSESGGAVFGCGKTLECDPAAEYCQRQVSDVGGVPDSYQCLPLPKACEGVIACECLAEEACGEFDLCEETPDGGVILSCPGG